MIYRQDDTLTELGESIREQCHTRIEDFKILYLFRDPPHNEKGQVQLGKASMPGALAKFLASEAFSQTPDFLIEVAEEPWKAMDSEGQEALMDHLLARLDCRQVGKHGEKRPALRSPNVQEFTEVLRRRKLWNADLREFMKAGRQFPLQFEKQDEHAA